MKEGISITIIACVDNRMGLLFNGRRLSRDRAVREKIMSIIPNEIIMTPYSANQFENKYQEKITQTSEFTFQKDNYYFIEANEMIPWEKVDTLLLFQWNRNYPADTFLLIPKGQTFVMKSSEDFDGSSHFITMEVYQNEKK